MRGKFEYIFNENFDLLIFANIFLTKYLLV